MAILVTGGTGFIGSHTVVELLNAGREVIIVDNFSNSKPVVLDRIKQITGKTCKLYEADLLDYDATENIFKENQIDSVIHFAGLKAVGESVAQPLRYYHNNITGTLNLLDIMGKYGAKCIVFSSSATVYGAHKSGLIGEDPKGIPNNLLPYISKVAIGALPCLSVFGNDYNTHDGTGVRDYIPVVDLADSHLKALDRAKSVKGVEYYNIGTGVGYSVLDIVHAYEKATGLKINYKIVDRRPGDIDECYADPTKAREILGWTAKRGIEEMCRDAANWQKKNPNGYDA